jgi:hypothetical protein
MSFEVHLKVDLMLSECPLLGFQNAGGHVCEILPPIVLRHASCLLMLWPCLPIVKKWTNKSYRGVHVKRHTSQQIYFWDMQPSAVC